MAQQKTSQQNQSQQKQPQQKQGEQKKGDPQNAQHSGQQNTRSGGQKSAPNTGQNASTKTGQNSGQQGKKPNPITVAAALKGVAFPTGRDNLVEHARDGDGDGRENAVSILERLPDREYADMADVEKEVGRAG